MNKIIIMGRLTKDPELAYTTTEKAYCRYSVAVPRKFKQEGQPDADFINCISWGKGAEFVSKYFTKGQQIAITGRIQTGSYEKDGKRIYTTDLVAEEHFFCGSKGDGGNNTQKKEDKDGFYPVDDSDDELPF